MPIPLASAGTTHTEPRHTYRQDNCTHTIKCINITHIVQELQFATFQAKENNPESTDNIIIKYELEVIIRKTKYRVSIEIV